MLTGAATLPSSMFQNLKKLRVEDGKTSRLVLPEIVMPPSTRPAVLILAPGEAAYNPAMKQAFMAMAGEAVVAEEVDAKLHRAQVNSRSARVYGRTVIVGWENVRDDQGNEVAFTPDEGQDFLLSLLENAPDLAARVVLHAADMRNYRTTTAGDAPKD